MSKQFSLRTLFIAITLFGCVCPAINIMWQKSDETVEKNIITHYICLFTTDFADYPEEK